MTPQQRQRKNELSRKYTRENKEKVMACKKRWEEKNPNYNKEYRELNKIELAEKSKEYQKNNRKAANIRNKKYREKYPDRKRDEKYRRLFGITLIDYNNMLNNQNNVCAICQKAETAKQHGKIRALS